MSITIDFASWHLPVIVTILWLLLTAISAAIDGDGPLTFVAFIAGGAATVTAWVSFLLLA